MEKNALSTSADQGRRRKEYRPPQVRAYGDIRDITQAAGFVNGVDGANPNLKTS